MRFFPLFFTLVHRNCLVFGTIVNLDNTYTMAILKLFGRILIPSNPFKNQTFIVRQDMSRDPASHACSMARTLRSFFWSLERLFQMYWLLSLRPSESVDLIFSIHCKSPPEQVLPTSLGYQSGFLLIHFDGAWPMVVSCEFGSSVGVNGGESFSEGWLKCSRKCSVLMNWNRSSCNLFLI